MNQESNALAGNAPETKVEEDAVQAESIVKDGARRIAYPMGRYLLTLVWHPSGWGREDTGEGGVLRTRTFFEVASMSLGLNSGIRVVVGKLSVTLGW